MKSQFAILEQREKDAMRIVLIDTAKATYQGTPWVQLGDYGKRKFENLVVLGDTSTRTTVLYA